MYWNSLDRNSNINRATGTSTCVSIFLCAQPCTESLINIRKHPRVSEGWGMKYLINKVSLFNPFLLRSQKRKKWSFETYIVLSKISKLKRVKSDLSPSYLKHPELMLFRRKLYCVSFWTLAFNKESALERIKKFSGQNSK